MRNYRGGKKSKNRILKLKNKKTLRDLFAGNKCRAYGEKEIDWGSPVGKEVW